MELKHPGEGIGLWAVLAPGKNRSSTIVTTHGALLRCYEIDGIDSRFLTDEQKQNIENSLYQNFNRNVPDTTYLQVIFDAHSHFDEIWERYKSYPDPSNDIVKMMRSERLTYLQGRNLRRQSVFLIFGYASGFSFKEFSKISKQQHNEKMAALDELEKIIVPAFEHNGIKLLSMDRNEVIELFYKQLNPWDTKRPSFKVEHQKIPKKKRKTEKYRNLSARSLRQKIFATNIGKTDEYVRLGASENLPGKRRFLKVLTLKDLPDETYFGLMEVLNNIKIDFRVSFFMTIPNQESYKKRLENIRNIKDMMAKTGGGKRDYEQEEREQEVEDYAATIAALKLKIALGGIQVVIFGSTLDELYQNVAQFQSVVKQESLQFFEEKRAHLREYLKTFPGMAIVSQRMNLLTANVCLDLAPIFTGKTCDREPVMVFENDRGELILFDLTNPKRNKWNFSILGATGSGKSVMTAMIVLYTVLSSIREGVLFVLDYAGPKSTYKTLAQLFGGQFVPVNANSEHALNPFPKKSVAVDKNGNLVGGTESFLVTLSSILLLGSSDAKTREEQHLKNVIRNAIAKTYKNLESDQSPTYSDVLATLESMFGDSDINQKHLKEVHDLLKEFLKRSVANLFNRQTTVKQKSDFVVIDLFGIEQLESNIAEALAYLATAWAKEFAFDPGVKKFKYLVMDEIAQLFRQKGMVDLVEEMLATARGHGVSVITITQKYSDYRDSSVSDAIQTNTEIQLFLPFSGAEAQAKLVANDFGFNEKEYEILNSIQSKPGKFSEGILRIIDENGAASCIKIRLFLSPMDYWVCTSSKADLLKRQEYFDALPETAKAEVIFSLADRWAKGEKI